MARFKIVRRIIKWTALAALVLVLLIAVLIVAVYHQAFYNRFVVFPKQAKAWAALADQRQPTSITTPWTEYRGCLHSHSLLSHDSEVSFDHILESAKTADINFIFMTDHCGMGKADFSRGWSGMHDGILFAPGYEMAEGYMPWGLPENAILDCNADPMALAEEIVARDGVLFYAHSEEDRFWDSPFYTGMEIYNIHTDFKDESMGALMPDLILSLKAYPDQSMRLLFDDQSPILKHWDELNQTRRVVGISANDAHENNGFRGTYTDRGTFLLRTTGTDTIDDYELNGFQRFLLSMFFGPLEPNKQLFRIDLDPYSKSLRFVNTHVFASELTQSAIIDGLKNGRAFIAFDMIADARGFSFVADAPSGQHIMGEWLPFEAGTTLRAESPLPVKFRLVRNGENAAESEGRTFTFEVTQNGVYRLEAYLNLLGEWTPWVYTNPIYIQDTPPATPPYPADTAP